MRTVDDTPLVLSTPSGDMRAYVVRPAPGPDRGSEASPTRYPGIVLFSEIYQRTSPIERLARALAGHGFVVVVPEIFHELDPAGTVLAYDKEGTARGNQHKTAKPCSAYDADAKAVIDWIASSDLCRGKPGAVGVCIGGHLAFRAALDPRVAATTCFYATDIHSGTLGLGGDDSLARARDIHGELMMVWGRQDPHVPSEGRALIQRTLTEAERTFTWHEFNAEHAFLRDEGPRFDPALLVSCLRLTVDFFSRVLT